MVHAFGVDHGSVGEDLQEHAELAAVVGSAQCQPRQNGSALVTAGLTRGLGDSRWRRPVGDRRSRHGRLGQSIEVRAHRCRRERDETPPGGTALLVEPRARP